MSLNAETAAAPDLSWAKGAFNDQAASAKTNMNDALAWAKAHGTTLDEALKQIQPQTFQTGSTLMGQGTNLMQRYIDQYGPAAQTQLDYALGAGSSDRIKAAMGAAGARVSDAFKAAGDAANRKLEAGGIDPGTGRGGALDLGVKLAEATGKAGAMDTAGRGQEQMAQGLLNQALGTGNTMAGIGLNTAVGGANVGATGIGEGTSTFNAQAPALGNALGWFGGGNQAISGSVNTDMAKFGAESKNADARNAANAANQAGWGKLAGTGASMLMMAAEGGDVPEPGSAVPLSASPSGGRKEDDVPARVQPGEFIFPKDVMAWKGEEWAQKEIMKARDKMNNPDGKPAKPEMKPALDLPPTYRSPGSLHGSAVPLGDHAGA